MNLNRAWRVSLALTGCLTAGFPGLPAAPANGSIAPPQTLQVSPSTVTAGGPTTLTFTYQTSSDSEVKGTITVTVPQGWSGTPRVSTADCAAMGCVIGTPRASGDTVTMPDSYLPPGQDFQISYDNAVPPSSPGSYQFTVTGDDNPVSVPVIVACGNGVGTMSVAPSRVAASGTRTLTFTYTAAGCGLLPDGEVGLEVPAGWPLPSPAAGGLAASSGTASVSGRWIAVTGATLPPGGDLTLSYTTAVPATPRTSVFPVSEQTAAGGTLTPLAASPEISVFSAVNHPSGGGSSGGGPGNLGSGGNQTGSGSGGGSGTHPTRPHHGHSVDGHTVTITRVRRHPPRGHAARPAAVVGVALLLAAGIAGAAGTLWRRRGRRGFRPGHGVGAVPNPGPVRAPVIRTRPGGRALVVRVEPHPGVLLRSIHIRQVTR